MAKIKEIIFAIENRLISTFGLEKFSSLPLDELQSIRV